jgi:hypothetical protein
MATELGDELLDILQHIPALENKGNRSFLLKGLPDATKGSIERSDVPLADVYNIVEVARRTGRVRRNGAGEWVPALIIVAENSLVFSEGTEQERKIEWLIDSFAAQAERMRREQEEREHQERKRKEREEQEERERERKERSRQEQEEWEERERERKERSREFNEKLERDFQEFVELLANRRQDRKERRECEPRKLDRGLIFVGFIGFFIGSVLGLFLFLLPIVTIGGLIDNIVIWSLFSAVIAIIFTIVDAVFNQDTLKHIAAASLLWVATVIGIAIGGVIGGTIGGAIGGVIGLYIGSGIGGVIGFGIGFGTGAYINALIGVIIDENTGRSVGVTGGTVIGTVIGMVSGGGVDAISAGTVDAINSEVDAGIIVGTLIGGAIGFGFGMLMGYSSGKEIGAFIERRSS